MSLTINQEAFGILSENLEGEEFRVLIQIMIHMNENNLIQIQQADIAKELEIKPPQVSKAIKRLRELEVILEEPRIGKNKTYRFNPAFGWKGETSSHNEALRKRMKEIGMKVVDKED